MFADDTFLCAQNKDMSALETDVNHELSKVACWLSSNQLTLNVSKSKCIIVSNKRSNHPISVNINSSELGKCDHYKYLGVIIDNKLNWGKHVDYISAKISKACGALARLRHCVNIEVMKNFYYALVHS